jgi:hypothetical protein
MLLYSVLLALLLSAKDAVMLAASNAEGPAVVGKLRASAEIAFQKGEMDQALKLWQEVRFLKINL